MKRDAVVVAKDYVLDGDGVGVTRTNDNQVFVGASGAGKSTSVMLPTIFRLEYSNPVISFAKEHDAYLAGAYLEKKGYHVDYMNLLHPGRSTVAVDCMDYVRNLSDLTWLCGMIIESSVENKEDRYWFAKGKALLEAVMDAVRLTCPEPSMVEVLELFDKTIPVPRFGRDGGVTTKADAVFYELQDRFPGCLAEREYFAFASLPGRTAACVRDTAAGALNAVFGEDIRDMMLAARPWDLKKFVNEKSALVMVTSAGDTSKHGYANIVSGISMRNFLAYAESLPDGCLPRPVRYFFDDFACTAPIAGFDGMISRFRSCGISAMMLLQSESQLESVYSRAGATTILNNCSVYGYMPGGMDLKTCRNVAERMDLPLEDVMYAPLGKVFIMQGGRRPVVADRYPTLETEEYRRYKEMENSGGAIRDGLPS